MSTQIASLADLKSQAKALRRALETVGQSVTHSQSLELLAKQLGHRDWNTLHAKIGNQQPIPFAVGQAKSGRYLSQPFAGRIIAMRTIACDQRFRLTIRFDQAVDVIPFDSMSNYRRQVNVTVGRDGRSVEKTTDGVRHIVLAM